MVLAGALSACGAPSQHPGVLRLPLGHLTEPPDPALGDTAEDLFVDSMLFSGLMKFGPDLHVIPDLAVSIPTISPDGRSYTFTIRHDARFADGTHVTAQDVAYSLQRALHLDSSAARFALGNIVGARAVERGAALLSGVRVIDDLSLRIRLATPDADFLQRLSLPPGLVVNPRAVGLRRLRSWTTAPAGAGPFRYVETHRGSIVLQPRSHGYEGVLALRSVVLVPGAADNLSLYKRGAVDAVQVPFSDTHDVSRPDFHQSPGLTGYYAESAGGNASPVEARVDRAALVAHTLLTPLSSIVPAAVPDYVGNTIEVASPDDPPVALFGGRRPPLSDLRSRLSHQFTTARTGSVRLRLVAFSSILPDPAAWLDRVPTRNAWYHWSLRRARGLTDDPVTRMSIYSALETWALQRALLVPLAESTQSYLIRSTVQGLQVTPLGLMPDNNGWASTAVT